MKKDERAQASETLVGIVHQKVIAKTHIFVGCITRQGSAVTLSGALSLCTISNKRLILVSKLNPISLELLLVRLS